MNKLLFLLALTATTSAVTGQCIPAPGIPLGIAPDGISAEQPIGFAFPLDGTTYSDIFITNHGICWLNNAGVPAPPVALPLVYTPVPSALVANGPVIAPLWGDTIPGAIGDVFIDSQATQCTITWSNIVNFGFTAPFSFQMTLFASGEIEFLYDGNATNQSTFSTNSEVGIVAISSGTPAVLPAGSDMTSSPSTTDVTLFEEFMTANTFDMAGDALRLIPTSPGWVAVHMPNASGCATVDAYGNGCNRSVKAFYEEFAAGALDLPAGTTITLLRQGNGYIALDAIVGTFVPPTSTATNIAPGLLDGQTTVPLSSPMPIAGGTTSALTITTKGTIALSGVSFATIDYTPTTAEFLAFPEPVLAPMWHDFDQTLTGSGLILFEEIGGIAYATWNGVFSFLGNSLPDTFQVQFEIATGNITIVYDTIANDGPNYVVGYKAGGASSDPGASDLSVDLAATIEVADIEIVPLTLSGTTPVLGSNWDLTTTNIDAASPISITFLGDARLDPGLPLLVIGLNAPGCSVYINTILGDLTGISVGGTAMVSLPIPNNAALTGAILTAQSLCLTTTNVANVLTSNGVEGVLGL